MSNSTDPVNWTGVFLKLTSICRVSCESVQRLLSFRWSDVFKLYLIWEVCLHWRCDEKHSVIYLKYKIWFCEEPAEGPGPQFGNRLTTGLIPVQGSLSKALSPRSLQGALHRRHQDNQTWHRLRRPSLTGREFDPRASTPSLPRCRWARHWAALSNFGDTSTFIYSPSEWTKC